METTTMGYMGYILGLYRVAYMSSVFGARFYFQTEEV